MVWGVFWEGFEALWAFRGLLLASFFDVCISISLQKGCWRLPGLDSEPFYVFRVFGWLRASKNSVSSRRNAVLAGPGAGHPLTDILFSAARTPSEQALFGEKGDSLKGYLQRAGLLL